MPNPFSTLPLVICGLISFAIPGSSSPQAEAEFTFQQGDRISILGGVVAERMQHHGWLEARLQLAFPERELSLRNLGFSADELKVQQRTAGFGSWDDYLTRTQTNVVFAFFGYNESFAGPAGLDAFEQDLTEFVKHTQGQRYDGENAARLVLFSALGHEDLADSNLPKAEARNSDISEYNARIASVAASLAVPFIDVYAPMIEAYASSEKALTINGSFLNEGGNRALADVIVRALAGKTQNAETKTVVALRDEILAKNLRWFNRYRATDGFNVYGGRSSLKYVDDLSNFTVLQRELAYLDELCNRYDERIQSIARGAPQALRTENLPELIMVKTNKPGAGPDGQHDFLSAQDAIEKMTPAAGMRIELFADETSFPELVNPVQMAWDTKGRLWVACWPTYPHWRPDLPMNDRLVILEDTDGDGRADTSCIFADDLHNPTGFEFWNGGVLVACAPDLLFLQDTDGDDVADTRERLLHGLSSADTHHSANSFVMGQDGALYFQEGTFHMSQVETIYGPVRNHNGCVWRYEPRTHRVERYIPYGFANPHGHVFDRWGQDFMTDGTGNVNYYSLPFSGHIEHPDKHGGYFPFFNQRSRPCAATEILSSRSFPEANQGNYLIANVIGFQGIFQYKMTDDGSGFGAEEVTPIVHSSDPRFRPSDIEVGPDGAIYFLDWHNPIIGHMQHHLRDPSRDDSHGRIYRVLWEDAPKQAPIRIAGRPIKELLDLLKEPENRVRYRARIELSAHEPAEVLEAAKHWIASLNRRDPDFAHHLLEGVWLYQQNNAVDVEHCWDLFRSPDPRARAAASRVVRQMRHQMPDALGLLVVACQDEHPRVRLEGVVAMSFFEDPRAAEVALSVLERPMDRFLTYALDETLRALEPYWRPALARGAALARQNPAGLAHMLKELTNEELEGVMPSISKFEELLSRHGLDSATYVRLASNLSRLHRSSATSEMLAAIERADQRSHGHIDHLLMGLFDALSSFDQEQRATLTEPLRKLATDGLRPSTRRLATVARIRSEDSIDAAWAEAIGSIGGLADLLDAAPMLRDADLSEAIFPHVLELLDGPPAHLSTAGGEQVGTIGRFLRIELPGQRRTLTLAEVEVTSNGANIAPTGTTTQSNVAWGGVPEHAIDGNKSGSYGDGGQTHSTDGGPNPWWELDLGEERSIDAVAIWNRTEAGGQYASRLDGFTMRVLDVKRRTVFELREVKAPAEHGSWELSSPALRIRRAAVHALGSLGVRQAETANALIERFDDEDVRFSVTRALRGLEFDLWPNKLAAQLGDKILQMMAKEDEASFDSAAGRELLVLTDELRPYLEDDLSEMLRRKRSVLGPQILVIRPIPDAMLYDRAELTVVAGRKIELVFDNTDIMPHNLVITAPGSLAKVGMAAEAMAQDPDAWDKAFVPDLSEVLHMTALLQPGQSERLVFEAPEETGDYPYVCTFPGHWVRMNGVLHVINEDDFMNREATEVTPSDVAASRPFVRSWSIQDFADDLEGISEHSTDAGQQVLAAASCTRCHAIDGAGGTTGPDLRKVAAQYDAAGLLAQLLEPSQVIAEGYETEIFVTTDGEIIAGRVLEETDEFVLIRDDPYQELAPIELPKTEISERTPSSISTMPTGLLSTFERGEILSLVAFLNSLKSESK
ncbi:MAG: putative heme-binding domain-containing protein [Planctomycetota bacterium]|jgi:putative heme-binding domain-containing protein